MGFEQGLSGLDAASKNLEVIGNNVANANTVGFKESQAQFADVYAASLTGAAGMNVGIGTKVQTVAQQFTEGNIETTSNPLDIAINGGGFFQLDQNGATSFSRNGQFQLDKDGYIVNADGLKLDGYQVANGAIGSTVGPLQIPATATSPPVATDAAANKVAMSLNFDSRMPTLDTTAFNPTDPTTYSYSTGLDVYDSLGNSHSLETYFVKTAANTWDVYATQDGTLVSAGAGTPTGTITFDSTGAISTTSPAMPFPINENVSTGATDPMSYAITFAGSTQYGSNFSVESSTQGGKAAGTLSGFSIGSDGTILGRFTNGQSSPLGQVALTQFTNPQGMIPVGNNLFQYAPAAGSQLTGVPGTSSLGVLQSSAVEDSNVDLTAQLVDLITAQRTYQANAQTIKTEDAVMNTLVTLQ